MTKKNLTAHRNYYMLQYITNPKLNVFPTQLFFKPNPKMPTAGQALVAHSYYPSYLGGRDQEDLG
jgi:hypothetical protein